MQTPTPLLKVPFVAQPADFYESAYSKETLLAVECEPQCPHAVHIHMRRPFALRTSCVWIDPTRLPGLTCGRRP